MRSQSIGGKADCDRRYLRRAHARRSTKGLYDEQLVRMDGRWDVGLDGDRRAGSGPISRHDQQGIYQVIACSRANCEVAG
jgi:hypothetical protein